MRYLVKMTTEDGKEYTEQSDKLPVAEHFYDCYVSNGKRGKRGFYVALLDDGKLYPFWAIKSIKKGD